MDPRDVGSLSREEMEAVAMDLCSDYYACADDDSPCARAVRADAQPYPWDPSTMQNCVEQIEYCTDAQLRAYLLAE